MDYKESSVLSKIILLGHVENNSGRAIQVSKSLSTPCNLCADECHYFFQRVVPQA